MDFSQLTFFYGFLAWLVCHVLLVYCAKNIYVYACEQKNGYLRIGNLIKFMIAGILFTGITIAFIVFKEMEKYYFVFITAIAIGVCTSFLDLEEKAERYYQEQLRRKKGKKGKGINGGAVSLIFWISWAVLMIVAIIVRTT